MALSKIRHSHVVTLTGHCNDSQEMILVYEYMIHGDLTNHLYEIGGGRQFATSSGNISYLTWEQRLNICMGIARGLDYLHTNLSFIYKDVTTSNILLDENWVPKIGDFGLSTVCPSRLSKYAAIQEGVIRGTYGYVDPSYICTGRVTNKLDVYSFGVVLLEVLCGRRVIDKTLKNEQINLVTLAQKLNPFEEKLKGIIAPSLRGQISPGCQKYFVEVVSKCLIDSPNLRPTMAEVVESLELALVSQRGWHHPFFSTPRHPASLNSSNLSDVTAKGGNVAEDATMAAAPGDALDFSGSKTLKGAEYPSSLQPKGRTEGKITKVFQGITLVPKGMNHWWRERKDNFFESGPSKDSHAGTFLDNETRQYRQFTLTEIRGATDNFSEGLLVGQGCSGMVYKGSLDGGTLVVAIKMLKEETSRKRNKVVAESRVQSLLGHHLHIVSLIGFCTEEHEFILVYDYVANGSLRDHLYGKDNAPLVWKKRLEVCIDAARVLQHLHSAAEPRVIHRNITSSKLLLDEKWVAKVADFTWSKSVPTAMASENFTTVFRGTWGYLDPEYLQCGNLTQNYDVYSFGVVLLEILCAKKASNIDNALLVSWFKSSIQRVSIYQLIDPYLIGKIAPECLSEFVKIALSCLVNEGIRRPSMEDMLERLQSALKIQESWQNQNQLGADFPESNPSSCDNIFSNDGEFTITDTDTTTSTLLKFSCLDFDLTWDDFMLTSPK